MQLCLVRHAIAAERGRAYPDDRERPLTGEGRKRMAEAAQGLKRLFPATAILTSPLLRARQTADVLATAYGFKPTIVEALGEGDHAGAFKACKKLTEPAILVGHEPWMGELLSLLLTGSAEAMSAVFKKGAAACVSTSSPPAPGGAVLEWLAQPAMLRRLR
jgi:phosphohistidine phosphatase